VGYALIVLVGHYHNTTALHEVCHCLGELACTARIAGGIQPPRPKKLNVLLALDENNRVRPSHNVRKLVQKPVQASNLPRPAVSSIWIRFALAKVLRFVPQNLVAEDSVLIKVIVCRGETPEGSHAGALFWCFVRSLNPSNLIHATTSLLVGDAHKPLLKPISVSAFVACRVATPQTSLHVY
jgi:hypothetical protein